MYSIKRIIPIIAVSILLTLTACDGDTSSSVENTSYDGGVTYSMDGSTLMEEAAGDDSVLSGSELTDDSSQIIRTATITMTVSDLKNFDAELYIKVNEMSGYFESSKVNDYASDTSTYRYAYYTIRIPQENFNNFISDIERKATVSEKTITVEDVTLSYADIQARIETLEAKRQSLLDLQESTKSVSDLISIQESLSEVQYQLESYNKKMRVMENKIAYSTVKINAKEERVVSYSISSAFDINIKNVFVSGLGSAVETFVGVIALIPLITVLTAFILLFIWVLRKVWRRIFKRENRIHYVLTPVTYEKSKKRNTAEKHVRTNKKRDSDTDKTDPINDQNKSDDLMQDFGNVCIRLRAKENGQDAPIHLINNEGDDILNQLDAADCVTEEEVLERIMDSLPDEKVHNGAKEDCDESKNKNDDHKESDAREVDLLEINDKEESTSKEEK